MQLGFFSFKKNSILDNKLFNYFYTNTISYEKQKKFIKNYPQIFINNFSNSKENCDLLIDLKDGSLIQYIQNNFAHKFSHKSSTTT